MNRSGSEVHRLQINSQGVRPFRRLRKNRLLRWMVGLKSVWVGSDTRQQALVVPETVDRRANGGLNLEGSVRSRCFDRGATRGALRDLIEAGSFPVRCRRVARSSGRQIYRPGEAPEARTISAHLGMSARIRAARSSGRPPTIPNPSSASFDAVAGSWTDLRSTE